MSILEEAERAREHGLSLWREKMCYLYTCAQDHTDVDAIAAIWKEAEQDGELCAMLIEIDDALHEEMLTEQGETPAAYAKRIAALASSVQQELTPLTSLCQAGQGVCSCGHEGLLYILAGEASPTKRCITCWKRHGNDQAMKGLPG